MTDSRHHDEALTHALRAVADDDRLLSASAGIEARLLNEALGIVRARRRRAWTTAGVLALVAAAIAIPAWRAATDRASAPGSPDSAASTTRAAVEDVTEFFPLMYSSVPVTNGQTVRLELPQSALAPFGLDADDPSGTVLADIIVGQDGLARAVRFVRPLPMTTKEPR